MRRLFFSFFFFNWPKFKSLEFSCRVRNFVPHLYFITFICLQMIEFAIFFVCSMRGCEAFRDVYAVLGYGKCLHHAHQYVDCHRCHGQSHSLTQRRSNQFHRMPWIFVRQWNCCRKLNNTFQIFGFFPTIYHCMTENFIFLVVSRILTRISPLRLCVFMMRVQAFTRILNWSRHFSSTRFDLKIAVIISRPSN